MSLTVLQVLPELNGGGVERGTLEIADALVNAGHRSLVCSAGGRMVAELEAAGSQHITLPIAKKSLLTFWQVLAFARLLRQQRPDILHLRSRLPAWVATLAVKLLKPAERPRIVTTVHGLYSVNRYSRIMVSGERVIAVSKTVEDYIFKNWPDTPRENVVRIYRGIAPDAFPCGFQPTPEWLTAWRAQYPRLAGKKVLCLPGRLTRLKGHETFLELLAALNREGPEVFGLIVGGEDPRRLTYAESLREKVQQLGLHDRVIFTGHRKDIREIYTQCDLVLSLSSKPESFGRTVLETLALGRPVIGWDHGGVGEILAALFPQGRVPLNDLGGLQQQVRYLLDHPVPPCANDRFLLANMCAETLRVYQHIATTPSPELISSG